MLFSRNIQYKWDVWWLLQLRRRWRSKRWAHEQHWMVWSPQPQKKTNLRGAKEGEFSHIHSVCGVSTLNSLFLHLNYWFVIQIFSRIMITCLASLKSTIFSFLSPHSMKKKNTVGMVMVEISLLSGLIPNAKDLEHVHMHFFLKQFYQI